MSQTPKTVMEQLLIERLTAKPALREELNAVIGFIIEGPDGGRWTLDLTRESDWLSEGLNGTPKMTLKAQDKDFVAICTKKMNAQLAAMNGKLKMKPMDVGFAMKLAKLLS